MTSSNTTHSLVEVAQIFQIDIRPHLESIRESHENFTVRGFIITADLIKLHQTDKCITFYAPELTTECTNLLQFLGLRWELITLEEPYGPPGTYVHLHKNNSLGLCDYLSHE